MSIASDHIEPRAARADDMVSDMMTKYPAYKQKPAGDAQPAVNCAGQWSLKQNAGLPGWFWRSWLISSFMTIAR